MNSLKTVHSFFEKERENLWDVLNIGKTNILCYCSYFINLVQDKNMIEEFLSVLFFLCCNGDSNSGSHAFSHTHPFPYQAKYEPGPLTIHFNYVSSRTRKSV
eukprot:TRINITY_DN9101_c0_g1_i4.p1 TRINITY_DN9101_c0_g1~~TRINITY_DN9101_c0_g1_i4.p1  ORF type:complete len:102 (-),score=0.03 TRINITY_DN9101_c0_g1_i4:222-527(-)